MKNLSIFLIMLLGFVTCDKQETIVTTSDCIETKIEAMRSANKAYTSVKWFIKNGESFWLFDNGAAFDAPQYMLNAACDTVCTWCFCTNRPPCTSDFDLSDSSVVVIWQH